MREPRLLALPVRARAETLAATALVMVYLALTMSRDVSFYDSAELALAAVQPGLSHPIGQPLHTLLGYFLAHLPGLPSLIGLNLLSALPAALAVIPIVSLAEGLAGDVPEGTVSPWWVRAAAPATAAVCLVHAVNWEPATRVEVYTLSTWFSLWACARASSALADHGSTRKGTWLSVGVSLGLCASANAFVAVITALALAPALLGALARRRLPLAHFGIAVAGGLVGLLPYVYVPWSAHRPDAAARFVWDLPANSHALRHYFTGADYGENTGITASAWLGHIASWLGWSVQNTLVPVLATGIIAHALFGRERGGRGLAAISLTLTVALVNANVIWFLDNPDYLGYLTAPLGLCAAGAGALALRGARESRGRMRVYTAGGIAALLLAAFIAPPGLAVRTRHRDRVARMMATSALDEAPRGAVVIVESDHWVFPLLYLQEAEGRRPDVVVLAYGLLHSRWYWEHTFRRHPELHAVALRGPGGRAGRIRRLLDANPGRSTAFERGRIASELGLEFCTVGWLLSSDGCGADGARTTMATTALAHALATVAAGSPASDGVITQVAFDRGEALWRLGRGAEAMAALNAGIPAAFAPAVITPQGMEALSGAPALRGPAVSFRAFSALGDPARNLFLAAQLWQSANRSDESRRDVDAAAALGLAEAQH